MSDAVHTLESYYKRRNEADTQMVKALLNLISSKIAEAIGDRLLMEGNTAYLYYTEKK